MNALRGEGRKLTRASWQLGMASLIAGTGHTASRFCSSTVAEICRSAGGSLSSGLLQFRNCADEASNCRVLPIPSPSSAKQPLLSIPFPEDFPQAVPKSKTFGTDGPVFDRKAYSPRKGERFRVRGPTASLKPQLTRTASNEEDSPVGNFLRASSFVAQKTCHVPPRPGFVRGKQLPIRSSHGAGSIQVSKAIANLKHCQQQGIMIDSYAFVEVLKRCSNRKDLSAARQVYDGIIQRGMDRNPYVANTLLNVYVRCGRLQDARRVFDGLEKKTAVTWNIMIGGYARNGHAQDAIEVFDQMRQKGEQPGEPLCLSVLNVCASPLALKWGKEVHAYIRDAGLESDARVGTALVQMYAQCGCITDARRVFDGLANRDVITWNAMIGAYAKSGSGVEAYRLFLQMQREGFIPDAYTYASILNSSVSVGTLGWVKKVHGRALEAGLEPDLRVGGALVHMYAKCGNIDDARLVFDKMENRDVFTWTAMIGGYAESGCGVEAYRLFLQMEREGFKPNAITYMSILNPSASAGAFDWVKEVHSHALDAGLESNSRVASALVHMYAKIGSIDDARVVFDRMQNRDVVAWTTMIGGLAQHGCGHEALGLFKRMNVAGVKPNESSFVAVLSACCHAGLVVDGRRLFLAMTQEYGIEPTVVHYNCMVDLLGRAGHLEEAKRFIDDMPVKPDIVSWKALLGACRTYGDLELGELAAKEVLKWEPKDAAAFVVLSNMYAAAGKWDKVSSVRTMMKKRGVRKEPGRSWIEVDSKIHEFVVGDTSHPEAKAIYDLLNDLTEKMKAEGYVPDTKLVLQNIDEEDKELALCSHSEKLAIAYGLLRVRDGYPIRIYKNLRVCSDCHTATKFISKVTGREIIARDANRFHHIKDGVCSCGDYW